MIFGVVVLSEDDSTIHRADYQRVLADEAIRLGAEMRFGANVVHVECTEAPFVRLESKEKIHADLVVGADGRYSARI